MKENIQNYRGVFPAEVVIVLEGNGKDIPFQEVQYVMRYKIVCGVGRLETIGKVQSLSEKEKAWFGN